MIGFEIEGTGRGSGKEGLGHRPSERLQGMLMGCVELEIRGRHEGEKKEKKRSSCSFAHGVSAERFDQG